MNFQSVADKMTPSEATSYAGGAASIAASLTLTELGVIVGIVTAVLTYATNLYFTHRKEKREQRESDVRIQLMLQQQKEKGDEK